MTPEGKVKNKISTILRGSTAYFEMPVPGGYGKSTLDYIGCHYGSYFAIEAKRPGLEPTLRQLATIGYMERAGAKVFIIDGTPAYPYELLEKWLSRVTVHPVVVAAL